MEARETNIGFIGGGRITFIILSALKRQSIDIGNISVYDPDAEKLKRLNSFFPRVVMASSANEIAKNCRIIFLAIHPPVFPEVLVSIAEYLSKEQLLVSLAPKITISKIKQLAGANTPVARIIPNAPSFVGKGFNVFSFSEDVRPEFSNSLGAIFNPLGKFISVDESKLEAYAVISGMGPTYFWFLFHELYEQALNFGLTHEEASEAINSMIEGASDTLFDSDLFYEQVLDLIPSYPLKPHEGAIVNVYREVITNLYNKLKT